VDFFLFLLVNATLFIRPAEIVPSLEGLPIYEVAIISSLIVAAPAIINHLAENGISRCPATACVLGLLVAVFLSHASQFNLWSARMCGLEFSKIVAYFLLLVSTVNTRPRLFTFLAAVITFTLVLTTLSVLQYHGYLDIPALAVVMENDFDPITGESFQIPRMCAMGIFNDPNDLAMIIVATMMACSYGFFCKSLGMARFLLAAPIGYLGYALTLTQSRGGLLALAVGTCLLLINRLGKVKGTIIAAAVLPAALLAFGERQSDFSGALSGGTGQARVELWSEGLQLFKTAPLFGIGQMEFSGHAGQVAHNSFVHTMTELGLFGGSLFLGLFGTVGWSLWRLKKHEAEIDSQPMRELLPFLMAMVAAYVVSMLSLSRCYVVPTYMVAGLAAAYERLARPGTSLAPIEFDTKLIGYMLAGSVVFIIGTYLYIKVFFRMM
jgi:O-antigen ligase